VTPEQKNFISASQHQTYKKDFVLFLDIYDEIIKM